MPIFAQFVISNLTSPYYITHGESQIRVADHLTSGAEIDIHSTGYERSLAQIAIILAEDMPEEALTFIITTFTPPSEERITIPAGSNPIELPGGYNVKAVVTKRN